MDYEFIINKENKSIIENLGLISSIIIDYENIFHEKEREITEHVINEETGEVEKLRFKVPIINIFGLHWFLNSIIRNISIGKPCEIGVNLMTVHKAKGLEFKYVFIVGFEEGYFPFGLNIGKEEDFEEERRILYVGITRAKINCYLSFALERTNLGANSKRIQSSFLAEINDFNFIQNYFIEDEKNYELYKNKYINISKRAKESQINKSKKEEKCRKYINLNYIKEEENENEIHQVKNNFYQNCNNIPTYANPFLNYNNNYYLENPIQVNKFDINSINNENYSYRARKENNPNEILNNEKNETTNEITKDKRKRIRKEKKADINKNKNKSKYKTIESCFNIK